MSALLIKLAVLVIGGLIFGALKSAAETRSAAPPPLPTPRAPYRPRRRNASPAAVRTEKEETAPVPVVAPPRVPVAASVAPRRVTRFRFTGAADLRRAFVASEILGRPVSLREPRL